MFFIVFVSAPLCLLCFYLAWLCYRKKRYSHATVLALAAVLFLAVTVGVLGAGLFAGRAIEGEGVALVLRSLSLPV